MSAAESTAPAAFDLAAWRTAHGLSQAEAARLLQVPKGTLQGWELGRYGPPSWLANYTRLVGEELRRAP